MAKIDWDEWRLKYVSGGDEVTLEALSKAPGAPALDTLKKRSAKESWKDQRDRFRNQIGTITHQDAAVVSAASEVKKIIDTAEMLTRHAKASRLVGQKAIQAMQMIDPAKLKPADALAWLKFAIEAERLTEGLATQRTEADIDLRSLSDAELERLARGDG